MGLRQQSERCVVSENPEKNPFTIFDAISNTLSKNVLPAAPVTPESLEQARKLFDTLVGDNGEHLVRGPSYDVTWKCDHCNRQYGYAVGPITQCPGCGADGILNWDRGWERVLPPIRFFKDGRSEP